MISAKKEKMLKEIEDDALEAVGEIEEHSLETTIDAIREVIKNVDGDLELQGE